ncbi:Histidine kinase [Rhodovastum atsumiense]|uniref:histidine kinase n=1 Tax=Rhodovastum atsumiense TaxID=504468 RepID=A0A5M6J2R5_9PROT|nr:HAMP domain-containing sensor histidine kinase [Rhodovastum atsumiense]KAA5613915.1 HAMP domain-containing histidine kinase [Rhodovastum atsumiense]CAH2602046.1 Histidine kinase [Rhodovastum atsumiense]
MSAPPEAGIALLCRDDATVLRVLRDELGLAARVPAGAGLERLVDADAREKLAAFLATVRTQSASFDWEITVPMAAGLQPLHFAGARTGDELLVVAARTRSAMLRLNEELLRINNEQSNILRAVAKELAMVSARNSDRDDAMFEELTRVNNELANLQREMARKNAELSQLNEEKNRLLGIAAHDLRSPLGIIQSYAEFLESEASEALDAGQRELVSTIRTASRFMLRLIDDLLDVSRIESGRLELDLQPVELVALVRHNVRLNQVLAARKRIGLRFATTLRALPMVADAAKLEQVLNNLLGNAISFSPADTTVEVGLEATPDHVTIAVADQGPGIPPAELAKLFQPFGRTSVRPTGGEKSTGLGLAIVRRIVEGHGGTVRVDSEVGRGSCFMVSLPAGTEAHASMHL